VLGYHRRHTHDAHYQEYREENYCNHEDWHTAPLALLCVADNPGSVIAVTGGCEPGLRRFPGAADSS
jgi:hypothetical protein